MSDNSKIWQLCLDTLEKQNLPEERKIDKVIMESVFRSAKIASINNNKVIITTPFSFNVETIKNKCGKDFPVILRFSIKSYIKQLRQGGLPGEDFKELGRDIDEAIEAVKILQEAGYDAFDADAGTYDSW